MAMRSAIDSLELVELLVRLEELGLDITDEQFARLQPFLVEHYAIEWPLGSMLTSVEVIAQQDCHVLALHDSGNVLVGNLEPEGEAATGKRYRSLNIACRESIRMIEGSTRQVIKAHAELD
jgi:hypothetical protein